MGIRKLDAETQERVREMFRGYSIPALMEVLGILWEEFERRGVLDRAWLVITADHGEEFWEHGSYYHGTSVYNPQTRIPLIVHPPRGETVAEHAYAVGLLDVTATLTAAVGAEPLGEGRDLRTLTGPSAVQIEFYGDLHHLPKNRIPARAVVVGRSKLIESSGSMELYRLGTDPQELVDLSGGAPSEVRELAEVLPTLSSSPDGLVSGQHELSVDDIERLRALGYTE